MAKRDAREPMDRSDLAVFPPRRNFGPALAVRLHLGGWQGDRRMLFPSRGLVDGSDLGLGYGNGIKATAPEPVDAIEIRMPDPNAPKMLTLIAPIVQVRGPWRIRFACLAAPP